MLRLVAEFNQAYFELDQLEEAVDDFTPFWDILIRNVLTRWFNKAFDTGGFGRWSPRQDSLPHPLLQLTGALRESLTQPNSSNNINNQSADRLEYGSELFYHIFHEQGTSRMNARPIIGSILRQAQFQVDVERAVEDYFQDIIDGGIR